MIRRVLVLAVAAGALVACTRVAAGPNAVDGLRGPNAVDGVRTVALDVHHLAFSQSTITVRRGEVVRFVIRNNDPIPHELIVGDEAVQDVHERGIEAHHEARPGEVSVAAGATAETTYTFTSPGRVLFGCHLPGHWAYGMRGTIRVV